MYDPRQTAPSPRGKARVPAKAWPPLPMTLTALSSAAVLHARTARIRSLSRTDMASQLAPSQKERECSPSSSSSLASNTPTAHTPPGAIQQRTSLQYDMKHTTNSASFGEPAFAEAEWATRPDDRGNTTRAWVAQVKVQPNSVALSLNAEARIDGLPRLPRAGHTSGRLARGSLMLSTTSKTHRSSTAKAPWRPKDHDASPGTGCIEGGGQAPPQTSLDKPFRNNGWRFAAGLVWSTQGPQNRPQS
jgi:hypothetical protein